MATLSTLRFGILGFGSLGSLIARRLLDMGVPPGNIFAAERPSNRGVIDELRISRILNGQCPKLDVFICATKQGQFESAWQALAFPEGEPSLIISFMAKGSLVNGIVFDLLYGLEKALKYIGAPRRYQELVVQVLESALAYRRFRNATHPSGLIDEVASPAGTTVEMRYVLDRAGIPAVFVDMARAAHEKVRE